MQGRPRACFAPASALLRSWPSVRAATRAGQPGCRHLPHPLAHCAGCPAPYYARLPTRCPQIHRPGPGAQPPPPVVAKVGQVDAVSMSSRAHSAPQPEPKNLFFFSPSSTSCLSATIAELTEKYDLNPQTIAQWRRASLSSIRADCRSRECSRPPSRIGRRILPRRRQKGNIESHSCHDRATLSAPLGARRGA